MKLTILSAVVAAGAVLLGSASKVEANPYYSGGYSGGYSSGYGHSYSGHGGYHNSYNNNRHCAPAPYKLHTIEVNRYRQCRTAYTRCGRPYTYNVTVVTYRDVYSNGTSRTWTRTFS